VRLPVLVSFATTEAFCLSVSEMADVWSLMLDSGAFTNWSTGKEAVTLDAYRAFLLEHGHLFDRYLNLDVIGDAAASRRNFAALQEAGLTPVPVFQRGGTELELREMVRAAGFVCIGGISKTPNARAERSYMRQALSIVHQEGGGGHLLGVTGLPVLRALKPASCDSSSWIRSRRYGRADLWDGFRMSGLIRSTHRPNLAQSRALRSFGVSWDELRDPDAWTTRKGEGGELLHGAALILSARSWMRYAAALSRQGITLHLATHRMFHAQETLLAAWEMEAHRWTT